MLSLSFLQGHIVLWMLAGTVYMGLGLLRWTRAFEVLLAAGVLSAGIICLLVEVLSIFHMLTFPGLLLGHSVLMMAILFFWRKQGCRRPRLLWNWRLLWQAHFQREPLLRMMSIAVAIILGASLLVAVYSPPNNGDSMTYHMARVGYWRQHASLEHYYANVERQNSYSPGAEILILWTVLLSGSDRWANLVQYFAFLGSLLGVYATARRLGFERKQSMFAVLCAATVPSFILEATSTQNDLVMGFFLIASLYFLLTWRDENRREALLLSCWAGGLSVLVKSLSAVYLPSFALAVLAGSAPFKQRVTSVIRWGTCLAAFLLVTCGPYLARNIQSYGTPTGPTYFLLNENISLRTLVGNIYRHIALHIQFPPVLNKLREVTDRWSRQASHWLGIELNDPATTAPGYSFQFMPFRPHEDSAGMGLPMLALLVIAGAIFVRASWKKGSQEGLVYFVILVLLGVTFIALFRWSPWHTRYYVPLVLLSLPLLAMLYQANSKTSIQICLSCAAFGLIGFGLASALFNYSRPLLPRPSRQSIFQMTRMQVTYSNRPWMHCIHEQALNSSRNARRIGLRNGPDDYEYPLFGDRFERELFPLSEEVFAEQGTLTAFFKKYDLDLIISTTAPPNGLRGFDVVALSTTCPHNTWPEAWRRSAYIGSAHHWIVKQEEIKTLLAMKEVPQAWFLISRTQERHSSRHTP